MQKVVLHIGIGKTGTSAIQKMLTHNRSILSRENILYPRTGAPKEAHHLLANINLEKFDKQTSRLYKKLVNEIKKSNCQTAIISSEFFCFCKPNFIREVSNYLSPFDVKIILYIREQVKLIESTFLQWIRTNYDYRDNIENFFKTHNNSFDFLKRTEPWGSSFGKKNITVRLFHPQIIGSNVCEDFNKLLAIENIIPSSEYKNKSVNPSLLPEFYRTIQLIDSFRIDKCQRDKLMDNFLRLSQIFKDCSSLSLIGDNLKQKIYKRFKKSNIKFANTFLSPKEAFVLTSTKPAQYSARITDSANISEVTVGKDGWIFLTGGTNKPLQYYTEPYKFSFKLIDEWRNILQSRYTWHTKRDIKYLHLFVPDKLTVYPEYFAEELKHYSGHPINVLSLALLADSKNNFSNWIINPTDYFNQQKINYQLFWKTDTHWTFSGCFSAYQLICSSLGITPNNSLITRDFNEGNLVMDLGGKLAPPIEEKASFYKVLKDAERVYANDIVMYKEANDLENEAGLHVGSHVIFKNQNSLNEHKVILFGDSFSEYRAHLLTGLLAETFKELHFIWSTSLDYDYIESVKPDIVITEIAERFMGIPPQDSFNLHNYVSNKKRQYNMQ